ncbi:MAG TPA: hypothetical protein VM529_24865 [Gemmata sp.]|jgi:hypothetical protein|nr:hypothetical protein [Gemmata sp.]
MSRRTPRPTPTPTPDVPAIVIAEQQGEYVAFRIASDRRPLSPVATFRGQIGGNPYSLFGEAVAAWLGVDSWQQTEITVATMSSGTL